jgi:hypothetical protein
MAAWWRVLTFATAKRSEQTHGNASDDSLSALSHVKPGAR